VQAGVVVLDAVLALRFGGVHGDVGVAHQRVDGGAVAAHRHPDARSDLHAIVPERRCGLAAGIRETTRLWRRHDLGYDQTKYVVEHVRRELALAPPAGRRRSVDRLDRFEVERLIQAAYRTRSRQG